jgi:hypothetical protein
MNKLRLNLEYCYGIKKLNEVIDFSDKNVAIIYAPNGTMKSSFAQIFEQIRDKKAIEELIYNRHPKCIVVDEENNKLQPENIIVVNDLEKEDCSNFEALMANERLRKEYKQIHDSIDGKMNKIFLDLKNLLKYNSRSKFDAQSQILSDWKYENTQIIDCLKEIAHLMNEKEYSCGLSVDNINYDVLFNTKVSDFVTDGNNGQLISDYQEKYDKLVEKSLFMKKGVIDDYNYIDINSNLKKNNFFDVQNEIKLQPKDDSNPIFIKSTKELESLIKKERANILNTQDLQKIFSKLSTTLNKNKDMQEFKNFFLIHPEIIVEYTDIEKFKKKIWIKAFKQIENQLTDLLDEFEKSSESLLKIKKEAEKEETEWNEALVLFKERFYVPFSIETINKDDVILNNNMASFKYSFKEDGEEEKIINKDTMLKVLSTGEKRAYRILNFIFNILIAEKDENEKLLILDDISDSFDYKNKYAIIEYIKDISEKLNTEGKNLFKIILLTHNFDFYRTITSRITIRENSFIAYKTENEIKFQSGGNYSKDLFAYFKQRVIKKQFDIFVASIPLVRNLIQYTKGISNSDYILLSNILHYKENTYEVTVKEIFDLFNRNWLTEKNILSIGCDDMKIINLIFQEADKINRKEDIRLEKKIILSMAIRLKAERFMINEISTKIQDGSKLIHKIYTENNQTGRLVSCYKDNKELLNKNALKELEFVCMITPSNIHLNAFMFEPIIDMSLLHLFDLYQRIKALENI